MPAATIQRPLSNAELGRRLAEVAQLLRAKGENPFKVRAYRRGAETIAGLGESVADMVRDGRDVTRYPGIGKGIAAALREIVFSGKLGQTEMLLTEVTPEMAALTEHPKLDPDRVRRTYKKLKINTVAALKEKLGDGTIRTVLGQRMEQHFLQAFKESHELILSDADDIAARARRFLQAKCRTRRVEIVGDVRRRLEIIAEISFLVECEDFGATVELAQKFGGGIDLVDRSESDATFQLPGSVMVTLHHASAAHWGKALLKTTGSSRHLEQLELLQRPASGKPRVVLTEEEAYAGFGLQFVPPELREGTGEIELARANALPVLVTEADIRGELHAHTTGSDGAHSIEEMASAAKARGYEYLGITDHSQSLKIAGGMPVDELWKQVRRIDRLNARSSGFRLLKSAEVDILADGSLDYPDDLLAELDYTVCSIHSRFRLGKKEQTERILRAMDHRAFNILGHATGRLLLKRTGYDLDLERIVTHARDVGCFLEINCSPDRLDLSSENVRLVVAHGVRIAINTDAHHERELNWIPHGIDVARRAGVSKEAVLNALPLKTVLRALKR